MLVVASYFGIASHNINVVTLHSLLKLPIRGKDCCELKGSLLAHMQARIANICYIIIDEFSVIRLRMLGWIDRQLPRASGLKHETFGDYSVIVLGDFIQLPPVSGRPIYHSVSDNATSLKSYMGYKKI